MSSTHDAGRRSSVLVAATCAALGLALGCGQPAEPVTPSPSPVGSAPINSTQPAGTASAPPPSDPAPAATPPPATPKHVNVVVITIDAMRADMPWNGYERDIAPRLTAFEKTAVSYTRAYALSSYTAMSMGGFLAGRYPGELARSGYFFSAYPEEVTFFPELLNAGGVHTLSAHAHFYFDEKAGFRHAFADYRMLTGLTADNKTDKNVTSPQHLALAKEMLGGAKADKPFFAWFHFMDPHDKYVVHEGYTEFGPRARDKYDNEMLYTDDHVGQLIDFVDAQPWAAYTAVVISADHGEAFGEHKMTRHGFELWEPLVHVPLMIRAPGAKPRRIDTPRSHVDLAPTFHDYLGVAPAEDFQGVSLRAELEGAEPVERPVIVDLPRTSDNFRRRAMVLGRYKIIAFGDDFRFEVYDVVDDPGERINLKHRDRDTYDRMKKRYLDEVKKIRDVCPEMRHKLKGKRPEKPC